ncbi:MAG: DUF4256 domain-containing protein [bacterium]|nr:DUF4256 domain-containing protein [bacterium]
MSAETGKDASQSKAESLTTNNVQLKDQAVEVAERAAVSAGVEAAVARAVLNRGTIQLDLELRGKRNEVLALVEAVLKASGMEVRFSMLEQAQAEAEAALVVQAELAYSTELSPEQVAFMAMLKGRYERNEYRIANRDGVEWSKIAMKLTAHPEKIDTLKAMEESGGAPDLYKVEGENFIFGDLSKQVSSRRNVSYVQAVTKASEMGAQLMSPEDYEMIGNSLQIPMDETPWVWLKTSQDVLKAGDALGGLQVTGSAYVVQPDVITYDSRCAFRCSLRV